MAFYNQRSLFNNLMSNKERIEEKTEEELFLSNPRVVDNYSLLQEIGVFNHIDYLDKEIMNYKNLFAGALDIFNRTTTSDIMDATVRQISDRFLPSFIVFLWKPIQSREDITIKGYKNYQPVHLNLKLESISMFEPFFQIYPRPISYALFSYEIGDDEILKAFDEVKPELIIPIMGPSGLYGMVLMGSKILEDDYTKTELIFIQNLMSFVSKAIQNHLHYE